MEGEHQDADAADELVAVVVDVSVVAAVEPYLICVESRQSEQGEHDQAIRLQFVTLIDQKLTLLADSARVDEEVLRVLACGTLLHDASLE